VRAWFFRWWDGLADLLQSGLLLRTAGSVSLPECRHVGAQGIILNYRWMLYSYGISLPYFEHVDIFPVRLCLHSHWVFSVYLILAIYLHSRLYHCGRNKTQELDPSSLV
jgi:hypothetical protein